MVSQGAKQLEQRRLSRVPQSRHRARASYATLIRQSRKLGQAAIQTLSGARRIIGQQIDGVATRADDIGELKKVVAHSHEVLARERTALPFLFPHEIILDRTKITIIKRIFFWSSDIVSIRIEDVLNVSASVGPLFGSVTVASRVMSSVDHYQIDRFWRGDAARLERVIQGYLIARQNGIRTDHLSCSELVATLYELGPEAESEALR